MANLNLMEALRRALEATKEYVDGSISNVSPDIITEEDINAIIADIDN